MNTIKKLFVIAAMLFLTACVSTSTTSTNASKPETPTNVSGKDKCMAQGGQWVRQGKLQSFGCLLTTKDAGKTCTDSKQCEFRCLAAKGTIPQPGQKTTGQCQANNSPFGCNTEVLNGAAQPTLCID